MVIPQPNSGEHIDEVVSRTSCDKHDAPEGTPCFYLYYDKASLTRGSAVCGERIKKAGFDGEIDPRSLRQNAPNKKTRSYR